MGVPSEYNKQIQLLTINQKKCGSNKIIIIIIIIIIIYIIYIRCNRTEMKIFFLPTYPNFEMAIIGTHVCIFSFGLNV